MVDGPLVVGVLLVLFVAGLGALWLLRYQRQRGVWDTFAAWHGLTLAPDELVVRGPFEGRPLQVSTAARDTRSGAEVLANTLGFGRPRGLFADEVLRIRFDVSRELSRRFSLHLEGALSGALDALGLEDEEVGDADLDATFELHGITYRVQELLRDEEVAQQFQHLAAHAFDVSVRDGWLEAQFRGVPDTAEALEALVLEVFETPRALEAALQRLPRRRAREA